MLCLFTTISLTLGHGYDTLFVVMKFIWLAVFTLFTSCVNSPDPEPIIINPPPYPVAVEINSVPPPFDMNGYNPYVVWMNGKRVNLPKKDVILLVNQVGEDNIPPADMRDIHRGWLFPYFAEAEEVFPITD